MEESVRLKRLIHTPELLGKTWREHFYLECVTYVSGMDTYFRGYLE